MFATIVGGAFGASPSIGANAPVPGLAPSLRPIAPGGLNQSTRGGVTPGKNSENISHPRSSNTLDDLTSELSLDDGALMIAFSTCGYSLTHPAPSLP